MLALSGGDSLGIAILRMRPFLLLDSPLRRLGWLLQPDRNIVTDIRW